jgi:cell fate regulator YaaT (PSP1 superfamily)
MTIDFFSETFCVEIIGHKGIVFFRNFARYINIKNRERQMTENQYKNEEAALDEQVFNRGGKLSKDYTLGQKVLCCSRCKLNQFDWMKDYENQEVKGKICLAEVRFKNDRKDYFTYPEDLELEVGEMVAVEAAIGHDIGMVTLLGEIVERQMKRKRFRTPIEEMKKIYRRARPNDVEKWLAAIKLEQGTLARTRTIAENLGLEMKLNDVEYQGDKTKAIFYYTADGRVDFRELIKKLAEEFHIRIEMRQIGVRQESAKLGGLGSCGRELCCASWISNFQSVTTGVARVQQLSPNPQKLAGQCGKLKCCLNYEYEAYVDALKAFSDPSIVLHFKSGDAVHQKNDVFKGIMWYSYTEDKGNIMAIPVDKVKEIIALNKKGQKPEKLENYAVTMEAHTNTNEGYGEADLKKMSD